MKNKRENSGIKWLLVVVFAVYLFFLIKLILFKMSRVDISLLFDQFQFILSNPETIINHLNYRANLVPFHEIRENIYEILNNRNVTSFINFAGNIVAFIPLGLMLPILFNHRKMPFSKVLFISLFVSLAFEMTQLVLSIGTFDVDDLILNTSGGAIGYLIFRLGLFNYLSPQVEWRTSQHRSETVLK